MDNMFENDIQISFDNVSRSGRWEYLRTYLNQLIQVLDENDNRLAYLQSEIEKIRATNLSLTQVIHRLSDAANEEVQREISLTLNDDEFDVVVDIAPDERSEPELPDAKEPVLSEEDFVNELMKLPGIGAKSSLLIANHVANAQVENVLKFAYALREVNADISKDDNSDQQILDFD